MFPSDVISFNAFDQIPWKRVSETGEPEAASLTSTESVPSAGNDSFIAVTELCASSLTAAT